MRNPESQMRISCEQKGYLEIFQIIPILKKKAALKYYREEVEYMDYFLGEFLRSLEENGLLKKTIVVIFGDHGEGHSERDNYFGHTRFLNRQFIHVPLILHLPGIEDNRIASPVSLIGISPTVLECLGIRDRNFKPEKSLWEEIKRGRFKDRTIFSFAFAPSAKTNKLSIIKWPYQAIFYLEKDRLKKREIYNFALSQSFTQGDALPEQVIRNTASQYHRLFQRKFNRFRRIFSPSKASPETTDKEMLEKLKALGYVDK
jgi:arylsulfatase A-like enzyme